MLRFVCSINIPMPSNVSINSFRFWEFPLCRMEFCQSNKKNVYFTLYEDDFDESNCISFAGYFTNIMPFLFWMLGIAGLIIEIFE